jgi:hypothetical protein
MGMDKESSFYFLTQVWRSRVSFAQFAYAAFLGKFSRIHLPDKKRS